MTELENAMHTEKELKNKLKELDSLEKMVDEIHRTATNEQPLKVEEKEVELEKKRDEIISAHKEENNKNDKLLSIDGNIQWRIVVNTETKQTQVLFNSSVANEGAILGVCHQIIDGIIKHNIEKGVKPKEMTRLRISQFEIQKLFGRCLTYLMDNKNQELTPKEEVKPE